MAKICISMQDMINDIMNRGEKLQCDDILLELHNKVEERRNSNVLSYYKGQFIPTKSQLTFFLKSNYNKEINNKQTFLFWK